MNINHDKEPSDSGWLGVVKAHVESLRFGTVQLVVHEARVVQIEKTEKVRLDSKPDRNRSEAPRSHSSTP